MPKAQGWSRIRGYPDKYLQMPLVAGRFYSGQHMARVVSTTTLGTNFLAIPFLMPQGKSWDSITLEVTTAAASSSARMGYYASDGGNRFPLTLKRDFGTVDCSTTGAKTIGTLAEYVPIGLYWLAVLGNASTLAVRGLVTAASDPFAGLSDMATTALDFCCLTFSATSVDAEWITQGLPKLHPLGRASSTAGMYINSVAPRLLIGV